MAVLHPLKMFLCLSLQLSSATFIRYSNTYIKASSHIYESNAVYSGLVPVNDSVYAVVRKALDKNGDSMGLWQTADENCYSNSTLYVKDQYMAVLEAQWQAPKSENITEVEIQAFTVQIRALTILSTLKLTEKVSTLTLAVKIPQSSALKPFFLITPKSIRLESLANRVFSSPITDAIYILLAFSPAHFSSKGNLGKQFTMLFWLLCLCNKF
uniref:Placenta-expressed transcript 1 protein n=1 Tax=Rhinopithecus roxellana TaxID=61622 RepID=A0A2K6PN65_RHIRO